MQGIRDFLNKYQRFIADEQAIAEAFPSICKKYIGLPVTITFKIRRGVIFCEGSKTEKNEILMRKDKILQELGDRTGLVFKDIR